ncbi:uncharacterized protein LOC135377813 isoform X2 [Ornithodoros turicata]
MPSTSTRERDRSRDQVRSRSRDKVRSRSKDRYRSKSKDRNRSRSKDRNRSRSKDRNRSRSKDRNRSRSKDRNRSRSRERIRSRSNDRGRSKERDRSKDNIISKERGSKDRARSRPQKRDNDKSKEKKRERSREADKPKERHRSKDRSNHRDKSRDRSREKDRSRERSKERPKNKSRDRNQSRERSGEKAKDKDGHRERSKDTDRSREKSKDRTKIRDRSRERERSRERKAKEKDRPHDRGQRSRERNRSRDRSRGRDRSRCRDKSRDRSRDRSKCRERSRDRSRDRSRERSNDRCKDKTQDRSSDREKGRTKERSPEPEEMVKHVPISLLKSVATKKLGMYAIKHVPKEQPFVVGLSYSSTNGKVAAASSDNSILLFDEQLNQKAILQDKMQMITGVRFSICNPNLLYNSNMDGSVRVWDMRNIRHPVAKFVGNHEGKVKPLSCFDFNCSERYLCAGTELDEENAYLLFWDFRINKILGGYWETHSDDITQIRFHPARPNTLMSGALDGLINVFDIGQPDEDEALQSTLNSECAVNKLSWVKDRNGLEQISCITTDEVVQLWRQEDPKPQRIIQRKDLGQAFVDHVPIDHVLDNVMFDDKMYACTGAASGLGLVWNITNESPELTAVLSNGHKDLPRVVLFNQEHIVTGGEDGFVCIWKPEIECPVQEEAMEIENNSSLDINI